LLPALRIQLTARRCKAEQVSRFLKDTAAALRDRHPGPSLVIVTGPDFRRAAASAVGALLALALGSALGDVRGRPVHLKVIALTAAAAFLLFGALTIKFVAGELDRIVAARGGPAAASAVRLLVTVTGYVLLNPGGPRRPRRPGPAPAARWGADRRHRRHRRPAGARQRIRRSGAADRPAVHRR